MKEEYYEMTRADIHDIDDVLEVMLNELPTVKLRLLCLQQSMLATTRDGRRMEWWGYPIMRFADSVVFITLDQIECPASMLKSAKPNKTYAIVSKTYSWYGAGHRITFWCGYGEVKGVYWDGKLIKPTIEMAEAFCEANLPLFTDAVINTEGLDALEASKAFSEIKIKWVNVS